MGDVKAQAFLFLAVFRRTAMTPDREELVFLILPCWSCNSAEGRGSSNASRWAIGAQGDAKGTHQWEPFSDPRPGRRVSDIWVIKRYWTSEFCAWTMCDTLGDGEGYMEEFHELHLINWWWPDDHWGCDTPPQLKLAYPKTRRRPVLQDSCETEWDHVWNTCSYAWSIAGDQHG